MATTIIKVSVFRLMSVEPNAHIKPQTLSPSRNLATDMSSFNQLPLELLTQIVWQLRDEHPSLVSLALTSRLFSKLVQPVLLDSVDFTLDDRDGPLLLRANPMNLLRAKLVFKPQLAKLVHSVDLTWLCQNTMFDSTSEEFMEDRNGLAMITRFLELLPSLKSLEFFAPIFGEDYFKPDFLASNKMDFLTTLVINEVSTLPATIEAMMCLKNIKHMTINRVMRTNPTHTPNHRSIGTSPISTLIHTGSIAAEGLRSILLVPRNLQSLTFAFKYSAEPSNWAMGTVLRPSSFLSALSLTQHSLVHLDIQSDEFRHLDIDKTRLDLSSFICLRTIALPSNFVFVSSGAHLSRGGLWMLLPPNIETLTITFVERQTLLDRVDVLFGSVAESLLWLYELALHKKLKFPSLSHVRLREALPPFLDEDSWIPEPIRVTYAENNINLKIYKPVGSYII